MQYGIAKTEKLSAPTFPFWASVSLISLVHVYEAYTDSLVLVVGVFPSGVPAIAARFPTFKSLLSTAGDVTPRQLGPVYLPYSEGRVWTYNDFTVPWLMRPVWIVIVLADETS